MTGHSLDLGPEAGVNALLGHLRQLDLPPAPVTPGSPILPGMFFVTDPESGTSITLESRPGLLFAADFQVTGQARWLALHIALDGFDLDGRMILGLCARSAAPQSTTFRPCLRNGRDSGFDDIFFRKTAVAYAEPSLHMDALLIEDQPLLAAPAPWRELVLFFRPETGRIELQDLRLFVV
ncbi:hypothetical protein [Gemmobacter denitrificans]|uniref:Uncharacterized protein n=1 Tax=Gemmobacter denitrificans TaxID=3123040 RepID=A0ABU8C0H1_9RHOB